MPTIERGRADFLARNCSSGSELRSALSTVDRNSRIGWMEGDGGLAAITHPAARVRVGLIELSHELKVAEERLAAGWAGAACKCALHSRHVFIGVGHRLEW
jgi:hypothetical protein